MRALARKVLRRMAEREVTYTRKFLLISAQSTCLSLSGEKNIFRRGEQSPPSELLCILNIRARLQKKIREVNLSFVIRVRKTHPEELKQNSNQTLAVVQQHKGQFSFLSQIKPLQIATSHAFAATVYDNYHMLISI